MQPEYARRSSKPFNVSGFEDPMARQKRLVEAGQAGRKKFEQGAGIEEPSEKEKSFLASPEQQQEFMEKSDEVTERAEARIDSLTEKLLELNKLTERSNELQEKFKAEGKLSMEEYREKLKLAKDIENLQKEFEPPAEKKAA